MRLQAPSWKRGIAAGHVVAMVGAEKCLAVGHRGIGKQPFVEKLINLAGCALSHSVGNLQERAEVVVVDVLAGQNKNLTIGFKFVGGLVLADAAVRNLAGFGNFLKVADVGQTVAFGNLEIVQVAVLAKPRCNDGLRRESLKRLLVGNVG